MLLSAPHFTSPHLISPHCTRLHLTAPHLVTPHCTSLPLTAPHYPSPHLPHRTSLHLTAPCTSQLTAHCALLSLVAPHSPTSHCPLHLPATIAPHTGCPYDVMHETRMTVSHAQVNWLRCLIHDMQDTVIRISVTCMPIRSWHSVVVTLTAGLVHM